MPIWTATPVSETPHIVLTDWQIVQVEPYATRHFVGYNQTEQEGRVSSAIVRFDLEKRIGVTKSGRVYELRGDAGRDPDAEWTWAGWADRNRVESYEVVTQKALRGE